MYWVQDEDTNEWRLDELVPQDEETIGIATLVHDDGGDNPSLWHQVQPTDTFQGICLKYKVTPTQLRQANGGFSGTNLFLAPNPLRIPKMAKHVVEAQVVDDNARPQKKLLTLLQSCPSLSHSEAKCYLELNDWNLKEALSDAKEDGF
jgi:hypothetical protein